MIKKIITNTLLLSTTIILLYIGDAYSKPALNISQSAMQFLKKRPSIKGHRLNYQAQNAKETKDFAFVINVENTNKNISSAKKTLKKKFHVTEDGPYAIKIRQNGFKLKIPTKKNNKEIGEELAKKIFSSSISKQFDLISVDTETTLDLNTLTEKASGYIFNYQRIFNGRVIRSANNYLTISIDSEGSLKWADISMEDFSISTESVETNEMFDENKISLDSIVETSFSSIYTENAIDSITISAIKINSAAEAYCEIDNDSQKILFPCISYASELHLSNNDTIFTIIDAPHSLQSWRNFNNDHKKKIHYAYSTNVSLRMFNR